MSKLSLFWFIASSSLIAFIDLPFFFLFGVVFVGIQIELDNIEKKPYPIISNIFLSAIVGWGTSFGVKYKFPSLFEGDVKIFSMLVTTLFAYLIVLYFYKNETVQKYVEKFFNKKKDNENNSNI